MAIGGPSEQLNKVFKRCESLTVILKSEFLTIEHLTMALLEDEKIVEAIASCGISASELFTSIFNHMKEETIPASNAASRPTLAFRRVLDRAAHQAAASGRITIEPDHVMASIFQEDDSFSRYLLEEAGLTRNKFLKAYGSDNTSIIQIDPLTGQPISKSDNPLKDYCIHLNTLAKEGKIDRLIGRDNELKRIMRILCRRRKNNPILVGDPGVGKTAIIEGLALKIFQEEVPKYLKGSDIYSLDMGALLAGTKFRGEFEERLKDIISAIKKINDSGDKAILFIDEIHTIIGAGGGTGGAMDASNILKPALAKGELHCIGSTTYDEFNKHFKKDEALKRRFHKVDIIEPTISETMDILCGLIGYFEAYHEVKFTDEAIKSAVMLSVKHIHDNKLPDKAIDVIDEAGANERLDDENRLEIIDVPQIEDVVASIARIPKLTVKDNDVNLLKTLGANIKQFVFGQDPPIDELVRAIKTSRAGLREPEKPVGCYLFAGPTGVGKTETAVQLARQLGVKLIRIDMSEFMEKHTITKLIGSPPSYVGYDDGEGVLIEAVDKDPYCVLLIDEIEKAHPDVYNIFLQVMDGHLTSNHGKTVRFNNVTIIMTTNAGARDAAKAAIGFGDNNNDDVMEQEIKKLFAPEFRNRLDNIMYFNRLSKEIMNNVVDKFINEMQIQLDDKKITVRLTRAANSWLAKKGYSNEFGARPLARVIKTYIKDDMAEEILFGVLIDGGTVKIDADDDKLLLSYEKLVSTAINNSETLIER